MKNAEDQHSNWSQILRSDRSTESSQRGGFRPEGTEAVTCLHLLNLVRKFFAKKESEIDAGLCCHPCVLVYNICTCIDTNLFCSQL